MVQNFFFSARFDILTEVSLLRRYTLTTYKSTDVSSDRIVFISRAK